MDDAKSWEKEDAPAMRLGINTSAMAFMNSNCVLSRSWTVFYIKNSTETKQNDKGWSWV